MLNYLVFLFFTITAIFYNQQVSSEITVQELLLDNDKPLHLKLLEALPDEAKIQYGPNEAKNTIIEFMDYFCGYCKKIHPELIDLVDERDDLRVIFLQHPILSESSKTISKFVIAANFQNKGFELHHLIFSISGSITQSKLDEAITKSGLNKTQLKIDIGRPNVDQIIRISSFLAAGLGARGTPTIFVNKEFIGGYIPKEKIIYLLE